MSKSSNSSTILRKSTITLGENRGKPRVYMQGRWLQSAGFAGGERICAEMEHGRLTLRIDAGGERTVSRKRGNVPVVDINSGILAEAFGSARTLEVVTRHGVITITPSKTERHRARRVRNGLEGSVFAGGGLLTEAGRRIGLRCAWAVEVDPAYAEVFEANHPEAIMHNMSVHEVDGSTLQQVEVMTIGLPCEPYSTKRRSGDRGLPPEAHSHGDLVYWALRLVEEVAPYTVVLEEVPGFLDSGAGWILRGALERMGYTVDARIVDPADFGEVTGRRRAVVIATTDDVVSWPEPESTTRTLGDLLEDIEPSDSRWWDRDSKPWIFRHWDRQKAKGNGFSSRKLTGAESRVPCISKRYLSGQGDGAVVCHPTLPNTYRWLTLIELRRLHGIGDDYVLPEAKTRAGEVIGQAVVIPMFEKVIRCVARQPSAQLTLI
jgi:DNA (cytosine-5)-methyltransferase 1